jgi:toluene monooxygenase system ferredoxin subunit
MYRRVCAAGELREGDMAAFFVEGREVLVLRDARGVLHAMDGLCPHEDTPLVDGDFDGAVLTCLSHLWSFDATTGRGISPPSCRLTQYAVKVEGDDIYVDPEREEAFHG